MTAIREAELLFRCGGRTWEQYGSLWLPRRVGFEADERPVHTRADATTCASYFDKGGLFRLAAAARARITWEDLDGDGVREAYLLLEDAATNVPLHNRDLTQAAWTSVNVTPVKDQTGIDGVASSASKLTATAGNGTCLQSVTLASSQRVQTAYVKRLTGSGTIQMTTDNGSTWTTVTVTAAWTRVAIPAQTLANPILGFRIVTSGDAIAVDVVQNETGPVATSGIITGAAAVTRAADLLYLPIGFAPMALTLFGDLYESGLEGAGADGRVASLGLVTFVPPYFSVQKNAGGYRALHDANDGGGLAASGLLSGPAVGERLRLAARLFATGACELERRLGSGTASTSTLSPTRSLANAWSAQRAHVNGGNGIPNARGQLLLRDLAVWRNTHTLAECEAA